MLSSMNTYNLLTMIKTCKKPEATEGELGTIKEYVLLRRKSPNEPDEQLRTPCHHAVIENQPRILEILVLHADGSLNNHDLAGNMPEFYAKNDYMRKIITALRKEQVRAKASIQRLHHKDISHLIRSKQPKRFLDVLKNWASIDPDGMFALYYGESNLGHLAVKARVTRDILVYLALECNTPEHFINFSATDMDGKKPSDYAKSDEERHFILALEEQQKQNRQQNACDITYDKVFGTMQKQKMPAFQPAEEKTTRIELLMRQLKLGKPVSVRLKNPLLPPALPEKEPIAPPQATTSPRRVQPLPPRERALSIDRTQRKSLSVSPPLSPLLSPTSSLSPRETKNSPPPILPVIAQTLSLEEFFATDDKEALALANIDVNGKLKSKRRYLTEAFLVNATKCFLYLLEKGASFERGHNWLKLVEYTQKANQKQRLKFLRDIEKKINTTDNQKKAHEAKMALEIREEVFLRKLVAFGLCDNLTELSPMPKVEALPKTKPEELAPLLFQICSGISSKSPKPFFNPELLTKIVIGLIAETSPSELVKVLTRLYPHFKRDQKLLALFIVEKIVTCDNTHHRYTSATFANRTLEAFFALSEGEFPGLKATLLEMIHLRKLIADPFLKAKTYLQAIISRCDTKKEKVPSSPHLLANEFRAFTLQFYQTLSISEFVKNAWQKENKLLLSPNIVQHQENFNKLAFYFVSSLLKMANDKERAQAIEMLINTAEDLLSGPIVDLDAAMTISAILESRFVSPYFSKVSEKEQKKWDEMKEILSDKRNYADQRALMANLKSGELCFPFLGVFGRDLTFARDNSTLQNKAELLGDFFQKIQAFQTRIQGLSIEPTSNLISIVETLPTKADDILERLAFRANPKEINLDIENFANVKEMLEVYAEKELCLKVKIRGETGNITLEEDEAVSALKAWLEKEVAENKGISFEMLLQFFETLLKLPKTQKAVADLQKTFTEAFIKRQATKASPPPLIIQIPRASILREESDFDPLDPKGKKPGSPRKKGH